MTFLQMRDAVRRNAFDLAPDFLDDNASDARANWAKGFVNEALHHVANWADRQDQGLFQTRTGTVTITSGSADEVAVPFFTGSPAFALPVYARFRRLIAIEQVNVAASPVPLQVIVAEERMNYWGAQTDTPRVYISGQTLYVVAPNSGTKIRMRYVYAIPDMVDDGDVPGEASGVSADNSGEPALPEEYHPLVVSYATVLALAAEASADVGVWQQLYAEQRDELQATLAKRRGARIGGAA